MSNCTVDEAMAPWVVAAVVNYSIVCVLGSVGNSCCVWCLLQCKRTKPAIKFQLICVFSVMATCSLITQPIVIFIYYNNTFCLYNISPVVSFSFSVMNSVLLQMERTSFAMVAVNRMVATCWPERHAQWSRLQVVVAVQVGIALYIIPVWLVLGALTGFKLLPDEGSVMHMINNKAGPAFSNATYVMYYAVPYFVTLLASLSMIKRLLQQRKVTGSAVESSLDHVIHATTLVIFVLLAMDFPHIVLHMFPGEGLPSVIIHMIFFHHLTAVPIIFVGYNPSHRRAVLRILHRHLPPVCRRVLPQPPCASVVYCDSVEMRATHKFTTTAE